ncbi:hypothetical protein [Nocardia transvalensis]|nr:hypothetical protein [Nocardia transvalensis]
MGSGSAAFDAYMAAYESGNPIAQALFPVVFVIAGLGELLQGHPF